PWPGGRIGQVILFGRDEDVKVVLAESLGKFLEWIAGLLESGNFRLSTDPGEVVLRQFRLKRPPADHFMRALASSSVRPASSYESRLGATSAMGREQPSLPAYVRPEPVE